MWPWAEQMGSLTWLNCVCTIRPQISRVLKASPLTMWLVSSSGPTLCVTLWRFPSWMAASAESCLTPIWSTPDPSSPTRHTGECWQNKMKRISLFQSDIISLQCFLNSKASVVWSNWFCPVGAGGCTGQTGTEMGLKLRCPTWTGRIGLCWWKTTWDFPTVWPLTLTTSSCVGPTQVRQIWQEHEPAVWSIIILQNPSCCCLVRMYSQSTLDWLMGLQVLVRWSVWILTVGWGGRSLKGSSIRLVSSPLEETFTTPTGGGNAHKHTHLFSAAVYVLTLKDSVQISKNAWCFPKKSVTRTNPQCPSSLLLNSSKRIREDMSLKRKRETFWLKVV